MIARRSLLAAGAAALAAPAIVRAQTTQSLTFYYPIAVGGPLTAIIDAYCADFKKETGIAVNAVYSGTYGDTLAKAIAAIRGGQGPHVAVLLAAEIHSVQDMDILVSLEEIGLDADAQKWLSGFYPAFMANSRKLGKTWSAPFQRSTAIAYYNKQAFSEAGLDPEAFPTTWAGLIDAGRKLVKHDASGQTSRWAFECAADVGNAQWTFGAMANQAGQLLMNQDGTETYFTAPKAVEAMEYWRSLGSAEKISPQGVTQWATLPADLFQGSSAIIQSTTGNLTNVRNNAKFPFGVAGLPGKDGVRTVVGGGNLYFMKNASEAERRAALRFARFLSTPERAADWCIRTGYIGTRPDAWETPALKDYVASFPAANVARSYLPQATGELSTFENQRVQKALTDQIQACLSGAKSAADAMAAAQADADRILKPFRRA
jgi:sn-glycerol 3-phosphate transport system substrate-binding protein